MRPGQESEDMREMSKKLTKAAKENESLKIQVSRLKGSLVTSIGIKEDANSIEQSKRSDKANELYCKI
jgi:hypothetical protein